MKIKHLILICTLILVIFLGSFSYLISFNSVSEENNITDIYPETSFNRVLLGENEKGSVELIGPIGNPDSKVKIAYIIGVHPSEQMVHNSLYNTLINKSDSLEYSYYIYKIDVSRDNYDNGREIGQLLANEFVVSDIVSKNYNLVVDVHSNEGTVGGTYLETNFIFVPIEDSLSEEYANEIISNSEHLTHYIPASQTSPSFVTIPIIESGTPTIIYETYKFEGEKITDDYILKLILAIENLNF